MSHLTMPVGERDHAQGPPEAPVTLVEYGDYECPYCGMAYPIVKELQARFGDRLEVGAEMPARRAAPARPARGRGGRGGRGAGPVLADA